jgi:hypothetical protein
MKSSLEHRAEKLLSKIEAMVLLCSKASGYWAKIKFAFNIPLVLTSSAMCIINSVSEHPEDIKIANIIVNAVSVLIVSLNNSIKATEKADLFRRLSQQFLLLGGLIENDSEFTNEDFNIIAMKYEGLINDILFEEIPSMYKQEVIEIFKDRYLPLQLSTSNMRRHSSFQIARKPEDRITSEVVLDNNNVV